MVDKSFKHSVRDTPDAPSSPIGTDEDHGSSHDWLAHDERALAALAVALGARSVGGVSRHEARLLANLPQTDPAIVSETRARIEAGDDPLGEAFCTLRASTLRRKVGAVYTPPVIVDAMLSWAETMGVPDRVVDPGAGSGRFLLEAGRRFPKARLVAVELDPLAALTTRANLAVRRMAERAVVKVEDFRTSELDGCDGVTLYIGNPPYVRHHLIGKQWKAWLKKEAARLGLKASALAGMYVYFFLAIASRAKPGDYGALITAAEWLDVNYGQLVRDLFLDRLGGQAVTVIEPKARPFPGTQTTGAVTTFSVASEPASAQFKRINSLSELRDPSEGSSVGRDRLGTEQRWSTFTRSRRQIPKGFTELGEFCRVHRGQVTGANRVWIAGEHSEGLPDEVLFPTVTRAAELFNAGWQLTDSGHLRRVIDLPRNLEQFHGQQKLAVEAFLTHAEQMGVRNGYVARHRPAWWSVRLRAPAPVLATYMARQPPAFVLNRAKARHINIAHGLYPREPMSNQTLTALVRFLRNSATTDGGREYAGGLTKYEPREMERIPVPEPSVLVEMAT